MNTILYSRISENRDERFLLSTSILEKEGEKEVQKKAVTEKANDHLIRIYENYQLLSKQYASSNISICSCKRKDDHLVFAFCKGNSIEFILDEQLKKGDVKSTLNIIEKYFKTMEESSCKTSQAEVNTEIFPSAKQYVFDDCYLNLNIDAIFSNVFVIDDQYTMIDYEWVIHLPVPLKFFYYRCILWFINDNKNKMNQLKLDLFHYFGFTDKDLMIYGNMENDFQNYVRGTKVPLWQFHACINQWKLPLDEYVNYERQLKEKCQLKVYYDYGDGFSEENSMVIIDKVFNEKASVKIDLHSKCVCVRIDVGKYPCLLMIDHIVKVTDQNELLEIKTNHILSNGHLLHDGLFVFHSNEPHIYIELEPNDKKIIMDVSLNELSDNHAQSLSFASENLIDTNRQLKESKNLNDIQKEYIDELNNLCKEKDGYAKQLEDICKEKENYTKHLEGICKEKDDYAKQLEGICKDKEDLCIQKDNDYKDLESSYVDITNKEQEIRKDLQLKNDHIENLETELHTIKSSFWFKIIMRIKKLLGRG